MKIIPKGDSYWLEKYSFDPKLPTREYLIRKPTYQEVIRIYIGSLTPSGQVFNYFRYLSGYEPFSREDFEEFQKEDILDITVFLHKWIKYFLLKEEEYNKL